MADFWGNQPQNNFWNPPQAPKGPIVPQLNQATGFTDVFHQNPNQVIGKPANPFWGAANAITQPITKPLLGAAENVLGSGTAGEEFVQTPNGPVRQPQFSGRDQSLRDQAIGAVQARLLFSPAGLSRGFLADSAEGAGAVPQIVNQGSRFANAQGASSGLDALTTDNTRNQAPLDVLKNVATNAAAGYVGGFGMGALDKGARIGLANTFQAASPAFRSAVDAIHNSPANNESGHINFDPLRHDAGSQIDGTPTGGRFKALAEQTHPIEPIVDEHGVYHFSPPEYNFDDHVDTSARLAAIKHQIATAGKDYEDYVRDMHGTPAAEISKANQGQYWDDLKAERDSLQHIVDGYKLAPHEVTRDTTKNYPQGTMAGRVRDHLAKVFNDERGQLGIGENLGGDEPVSAQGHTRKELTDMRDFYVNQMKLTGDNRRAFDHVSKQISAIDDELQTVKGGTKPPKNEESASVAKSQIEPTLSDIEKSVFKSPEEEAAQKLADKKAPVSKAEREANRAKNDRLKAADQAKQDAIAKAIAAPTKNHVDITPGSGGIKSAIANSEHIHNELIRRANKALNFAKGLSKEDRLLANEYENGSSIENLELKAKDPQRLRTAIKALEDYYDYKLAAERAAGAQVPKVNQYARHFWDLSRPEDAERFNQLAHQQGVTDFKGTSAQPRIFRTYAEGEAAGFVRQHDNIFRDLQQDAKMSSYRISNAVLKEGVLRAGGEKVSDKGSGVDANGKPFINSNIQGLNGLSYTKEIADQLKGYNELNRNQFGKNFDKLNAIQKSTILSLSLFHSTNISLNFAGSTAFTHPIVGAKGLAQSLGGLLNKKYAQHVLDGFQERGVTEWAQKNGISVGSESDVSLDGGIKVGSLKKVSPIAKGHDMIFQQEIPIMTLHLAELGKKKGIEPGSAEGIAFGQEVNNVMGLLNQKILARDPNTQKWLNRMMLAPAFTESKLRTLADSATKWGGDNQKAGNLARSAVLGKSALSGIIGITGTIIATGSYPTLTSVIGQFTDPHIDTKIKNKNGGTKTAYLPHSFISEFLDPALKTIHGDPSGIIHYGQARLSPNISTGISLSTNQDYFGNPIYNPDKPTLPQVPGQVVKKTLPIGAQNVLNATGPNAKGIPETLLDEAGLRVKNNPNDPINKKTADYFAAVDAAKKGLNQNDLAVYNAINPEKKNPDGTWNEASKFDPSTAPAKTLELLAHPKVLAAVQKVGLTDSNPDPMWNLSPDDLHTFMLHQVHQATDYQGAQSKEDLKQNPWIKDVNKERSAWFDTLPPSKNPNGANPLKYPTADPYTQGLLDQANAITDTKAKYAFQDAHPEIAQFYAGVDQYTNARRLQEGATPFAQGPVASPQVQAMMDAGNFRDPAVRQYLNANAAFKASGPFGDGVSGGGGGRNTSAQTIANLASTGSASGKSSSRGRKAVAHKARVPKLHIAKVSAKPKAVHSKITRYNPKTPRGFRLG